MFLEAVQDLSRWWGIIGLVFVIVGLLYHCTKRGCGLTSEVRRRNGAFLLGGIFLFVYSVIQRDLVFAVLQVAFSLAALWELSRTYRTKKK